MTTIAQVNGKWYVVRQDNDHPTVWAKISPAFDTSFDARSYQLDIIMGRVQS